MNTRNTLTFLISAGIINLSLSASAATAFVLDNTVPDFADGLNNGDSLTVEGITLTFSNVVISNGSSFGDVEGVGILMSSSTDPTASDVVSFDITFNQRVEILTYDIGGREDVPVNSFFTLTGFNGTSGNNEIPAITGATTTEVQRNFNSGTIPFLEANQAYTFSHNLPAAGDPLFNLEEINVAAVPEPSSSALLALGGLGILTRRTRKA